MTPRYVTTDEWVYFEYTVPNDTVANATHVRFSAVKYSGDVSLIARADERPVRLIYPYTVVEESTETAAVETCGVEPGQVVYLGVRGGDHCAAFEVEVETYTDGDGVTYNCTEEPEEFPGSSDKQGVARPLEPGVWEYGSCEAGAWSSTVSQCCVTCRCACPL